MASHPFEISTDRGQTAVERSLAEIRAGRPVLVQGQGEAVLVASAESLEPELCQRLAPIACGRPRLVLAAARLRRLGVERTQAGVICCPVIDHGRIAQLALKLDARIDAPVAPPAALDEDALELMRLALVLPAALVVPVDARTLDGSVLRVESEAVRTYRRAKASDVKIVSRAPVPLEGASETEFVVFRGGEGLRDQVAIVVGSPDLAGPVAVRLHSACLTGDLFGSLKCDCGDQLRDTVRHMAEGEGGILLYLDQEGRGNGIANKIRAYKLQAQGYDTYDADEMLGFDQDQRRFEFAAEMLAPARREERAHHDQQPGQDRGAREGRPRRRVRSSGCSAARRPRTCAISPRSATAPATTSISIRSPRLLRRTTEPGPSGRGPLPAGPLPAVSSAAGWPLWPTVGLFGLAWLALSWPWLSGRVTVPWDAKAHFYPQLQFLAQSIHRGEAPFWAPHAFSGHPQIADPQSLIFSPPHLLLALLDADPSFRAADAVVLGMLGLGGVALILSFRDRGWHPIGAVAAALAFAFGASAAWRIQHVGQVMSLSYWPIALWLLLRALERGSLVFGLMAGVAAGLMALGRDQVAYLGLWLLVGAVLWSWAAAPLRRAAIRRSLPPLLARRSRRRARRRRPGRADDAPVRELEPGRRSTLPAPARARCTRRCLFTGVIPNLFGADGPFLDYWGPPSPRWGPVDLFFARNMGVLYIGALPIAAIAVGAMRGVLWAREIRFFTIAAAALHRLRARALHAGLRAPVLAPARRRSLPPPGRRDLPLSARSPRSSPATRSIAGGAEPCRPRPRGTALLRSSWLRRSSAARPCSPCTRARRQRRSWRLRGRSPGSARPSLLVAADSARLRRSHAWATAATAAVPAFLVADLAWNNGPNESTALPPAVYEVLRPESRDPLLGAAKARLGDALARPHRADRPRLPLAEREPRASPAQRARLQSRAARALQPSRPAPRTRRAAGAAQVLAALPVLPLDASPTFSGCASSRPACRSRRIDPKLRPGDLNLRRVLWRTATSTRTRAPCRACCFADRARSRPISPRC